MTSKKISAPEKIDLDHLVDQLEELIVLCERLQHENIRLKSKQTQLQSTHGRLSDRSETSRRKIEAMISRLKILETEL